MTVDQLIEQLTELSTAGHGKLRVRSARRREHGYLLIPSVTAFRVVSVLDDLTLCLSAWDDDLTLPFVELELHDEDSAGTQAVSRGGL